MKILLLILAVGLSVEAQAGLKEKILSSPFETDCFSQDHQKSHGKCETLKTLFREFQSLRAENPKVAENTLREILNTQVKNQKYRYLPFLLVKLYPPESFAKELKALKALEVKKHFPFHYAKITEEVMAKGHCSNISSPFFYELCRWKPAE